MKTRNVAWFLTVVIAVAAAAGIIWAATGTFDKTFTQSELQQKIDAKMPFSVKTVNVQNVKLNLADDKINLTFDASTVKFRRDYAVSATTTGRLRYDSNNGAFFFSPEKVTVSNMTINDQVVGSKVNGFIDRVLGDSKLAERKDARKEAANNAIQKTVQDGAQVALERIPVYKLKDDIKGTVIKLSLSGVEVRDNTVVAHISFWRLTASVLLFCVAFVFALVLAFALVLSPGWGAVPLLFL